MAPRNNVTDELRKLNSYGTQREKRSCDVIFIHCVQDAFGVFVDTPFKTWPHIAREEIT
jgi:hypothetical protein